MTKDTVGCHRRSSGYRIFRRYNPKNCICVVLTYKISGFPSSTTTSQTFCSCGCTYTSLARHSHYIVPCKYFSVLGFTLSFHFDQCFLFFYTVGYGLRSTVSNRFPIYIQEWLQNMQPWVINANLSVMSGHVFFCRHSCEVRV